MSSFLQVIAKKPAAWNALKKDADRPNYNFSVAGIPLLRMHLASSWHGKCGTLVAWQHRGVAAEVCFIDGLCPVILLQRFWNEAIVFKNWFRATFCGCSDRHRIWPSWFGPDFDLLYFFTSLFSKCRCLKRRIRLFPLEQSQSAYYSVHRSSIYRLVLILGWRQGEYCLYEDGMNKFKLRNQHFPRKKTWIGFWAEVEMQIGLWLYSGLHTGLELISHTSALMYPDLACSMVES